MKSGLAPHISHVTLSFFMLSYFAIIESALLVGPSGILDLAVEQGVEKLSFLKEKTTKMNLATSIEKSRPNTID